uniref:Uncharacterized protein n=1 Tax=Caenorhabditis japonica TaxID=281687 RepID=A0A8R1IJW6_CAEJA
MQSGIPRSSIVNLLPVSSTQFAQFSPILDHFNVIVGQRKLLHFMKSFEIPAETETLLKLHGMFYSRQLTIWLKYFEDTLKMSSNLKLTADNQQLLNRVVQKLKELQSEMPEDKLDEPENAKIVKKIEKEFKKKHGFIVVLPADRLAPIPNGKMELPQKCEPKNKEEEKMFELIMKDDAETANIVKQLQDDGVPEDDMRIMNVLTRRYKNKILNLKYFSILPQ